MSIARPLSTRFFSASPVSSVIVHSAIPLPRINHRSLATAWKSLSVKVGIRPSTLPARLSQSIIVSVILSKLPLKQTKTLKKSSLAAFHKKRHAAVLGSSTNRNVKLPLYLIKLNKGEITCGSKRPNLAVFPGGELRCLKVSACNNEKTGRAMHLKKRSQAKSFMKAWSCFTPVKFESIVVCNDGVLLKELIDGLRRFGMSKRRAQKSLRSMTRASQAAKRC